MKNNFLNQIKFYILFGMVTVMHFLVTGVVILLILSTLNILNQNILHIIMLKYIEIALSLAIFIISGLVYFKSINKLSHFIRENILKEQVP